VAATEVAVLAMKDDIAGILAEVVAPPPAAPPAPKAAIAEAVAEARVTPEPKPVDVEPTVMEIAPKAVAAAKSVPEIDTAPRKRPAKLLMASAETERRAASKATPVIVTRVSTSGGRHWGVNLGRFASRGVAERALMQTALSESTTLRDGLRKVIERKGGSDANYMGSTQQQAGMASGRLQARAVQCFTIGP